MVHLERAVIPVLEKFMKPCKKYVDDTIAYIKQDSIKDVISILNKFHENIKFTFELEHDDTHTILSLFINE